MEGSLVGSFARGFERFGWHREACSGRVEAREWLPGALAVFVFGDFCAWRRHAHPLARDEFGVWTGAVGAQQQQQQGSTMQQQHHHHNEEKIVHGGFVKLGVLGADEAGRPALLERVPAWIRRCEVRPPNVHLDGVFWEPPPEQQHVWKHPRVSGKGKTLRIYEAHVGMSSEEGKVATYEEFRVNVLPRAAKLGYTAVQMMAIMEHPYYGSFGYQVFVGYFCWCGFVFVEIYFFFAQLNSPGFFVFRCFFSIWHPRGAEASH